MESRPRDAHRAARRNRNQLGQISLAATQAMGGVGQKAAIVVAASGLAMAVAVPTATVTAAGEPAEAQRAQKTLTASAAATTSPDSNGVSTVKASDNATVSFVRSDVTSSFDPEKKLASVMTAAAGEAEPAASEGSLDMPVPASNMTSSFGYRTSPITGFAGEMHTGQDFGIACGTEVAAAAEGVVKEAGWHPFGGGNRIVVDHGGGLETTYNHLSSIAVSAGQSVSRGQTVGVSGTTGASTGCHLHFEVVVNGQTVDPLGWL
ncbi:M23 family metallopeptidase [Arthrobacter monumenti]